VILLELCLRAYQVDVSRDRPILLQDLHGRVVAVATPSPNDPETVEAIRAELEALHGVGFIPKEGNRGGFKIVHYGLQFGGGSEVRSTAIDSHLAHIKERSVLDPENAVTKRDGIN
jgi:hypothetical protein